ncbi:hypothetical protein [Sanguibacter sp. HDW7]|uniref:hypothetical protein n=1 Tax=Sanguibacter sp. HDW7 TaxID=2714931 RepID=UPI00140DEB0B|nr:hypothetical protein [Sanguibacter sp. HDW7]QIK82195.1 hypothetical protein G7063_00085 [Sanguibacter sp. HDW7]
MTSSTPAPTAVGQLADGGTTDARTAGIRAADTGTPDARSSDARVPDARTTGVRADDHRARPRTLLATSTYVRPGSTTEVPVVPDDRVELARELPPGYVAGEVRAGNLVKLRRGAYVSTELAKADGYVGAHRRAVARVRAVAGVTLPDRTVSHVSAALLHGLPTWWLPARVHLSQPIEPRVRKGDDVVRHVVPVPDDDVVEIDGMRVTSLPRTVVDCLCTFRPWDALVLVDAALRRGVDVAELLERLAAKRGHRGVRRAATVLDAADAGAESPGVSLTRYVLLAGGLPRPSTQIEVATRHGTVWADLGWKDHRLLAEYDGEGKYATRADLMREKQREDDLREAGNQVVRVTKGDLRDPDGLVRRVAARLPMSARRARGDRAGLPQIPVARPASPPSPGGAR